MTSTLKAHCNMTSSQESVHCWLFDSKPVPHSYDPPAHRHSLHKLNLNPQKTTTCADLVYEFSAKHQLRLFPQCYASHPLCRCIQRSQESPTCRLARQEAAI